MRGGGSVQSGACEGAECGVAACGRARFDTVYEKEMMQPLDSAQCGQCVGQCVDSGQCVELCDDV
jgi:hypothetical protein